jgi:hypothetical protein
MGVTSSWCGRCQLTFFCPRVRLVSYEELDFAEPNFRHYINGMKTYPVLALECLLRGDCLIGCPNRAPNYLVSH